jgi:Lipase (class 3)
MVSDAQIAAWLVDLYAGPAGFDHYEPGQGDSGICWGLKLTADYDYVLLRGSVTPEDWLRDFIALATPFEHHEFGPVHPGFLLGMEDMMKSLYEVMGHSMDNLIIAGHSLGAGRAAILTALMISTYDYGCYPVARVVFGEPKPGFPQLAEYIANVPARSYRNGTGIHHDMITDVPLTLPPLENYVHPCPLTLVNNPPANVLEADLDVFGYHHMPLYAAALAKLEAQGG